MKYLHISIAVIGFLLAAIWYVPTLIWGYKAATYTDAAMADPLTPEQDPDALAEIQDGPAPLAWLREQRKLRTHFRLDQFNDDRTVQFEQRISIDDLLTEDEPRPDPTLYKAYATARAPAFFAAKCEELLDTIASACKVYHSEARTLSHQPGTVEIESRVTYIPSYPLGDTSAVSNGTFRTASAFIEKHLSLSAHESRRAVYRRAAEICGYVRGQLGNCVIESVRFDDQFMRLSGAAAGTRPPRAFIRFSVFVNSTTVGRNDLDPIIEIIATSLEEQTG